MDIFVKDNLEYVMYGIALIVFVILFFLARKKVNFSIRVLTALALGVIVGLLFKEGASHLRVFGTVYLNLIKTIVIPLITVAVIRSFTQLEDMNALRKIGLKSLFWLLITTGIGAALALVAGSVFNLGEGFNLPQGVNNNTPFKFVDAIANLVPSNLITHASRNEVLQIIFFLVLVSVAVIMEGSRHPERVKPFKDFINSAYVVMTRVTKLVLRFTPYGVFGLVAHATARNNADSFKQLAFYIIIIYAVMIFHFLVIHLPMVSIFGRVNPIRWIRKVYPAQIVALTTQSSYGTLPVTISSLKRAGVSDRVANFVAPLGANMGMNACSGIYPALVAVFTANATGTELTLINYVTIIIASMIASIGIAGVPGIASVVATVVLASVGLPLEGLLLVIAVDAFVDMGRTSLNVTGTLAAATVVARSENELDDEIFNSDVTVDEELQA